jgi:hypothetical protein
MFVYLLCYHSRTFLAIAGCFVGGVIRLPHPKASNNQWTWWIQKINIFACIFCVLSCRWCTNHILASLLRTAKLGDDFRRLSHYGLFAPPWSWHAARCTRPTLVVVGNTYSQNNCRTECGESCQNYLRQSQLSTYGFRGRMRHSVSDFFLVSCYSS